MKLVSKFTKLSLDDFHNTMFNITQERIESINTIFNNNNNNNNQNVSNRTIFGLKKKLISLSFSFSKHKRTKIISQMNTNENSIIKLKRKIIH